VKLNRLLLVLALAFSTPLFASTANPSNTTYRLLSAAGTTNATSVTTAPTYVGTIVGYNASTSARWIKMYEKATAPTSTDTPRQSYYIPPSTAFVFDVNEYYTPGMGFRIVAGSADNDNTAGTAGDILGLNISYR